MATQRRRFRREFKVEAVRLVLERGVSAAHAARDLGFTSMCCAIGSGSSGPIPPTRSPAMDSRSLKTPRSSS
jgi:hypothetical protein